jgi:hypothetical protein
VGARPETPVKLVFWSIPSIFGSTFRHPISDSVLEPKRRRSAIFDRRYKNILIENLEKLAGNGLGRVVPNVEQEKTGAFEVQSLFFSKTVEKSDFQFWRILIDFEAWLLGSGAKRRRTAIFDRR